MEPMAREATRRALVAHHVRLSEDEREGLVLGSYLGEEKAVFDLYVPGEKPADARVVCRAIVDRVTGDVEVQFEPTGEPPF
jgi:hypothetical protein